MAVKIALSEHVEKFGDVAVLKWLKREQDLIMEGDTIALVREDDEGAIAIRASEKGMLAKILIPEGTRGLFGKEIIGVVASLGDDKDSIIRTIMVSQHFNSLYEGATLADDSEEGDENDEEDESEDDEDQEDNPPQHTELVPQQPYQAPFTNELTVNGKKGLTFLCGGIALIVLFSLTSLPSFANIVLWLIVLSLGGASLYFTNQLIEERDQHISVLIPSVSAVVAAIVLLIIGLIGDQNHGGFVITQGVQTRFGA